MDKDAYNPGRIVHLVLRPRFSGAETLVRELAFRQRPHWDRVSVIGLQPSEEEFIPSLDFLESKGVDVRVPDRELNRLQSLFFFRKAVAELKPSCIFAHSVLPGFYARGSFALLPCPMVTVLHDGSCRDYAGEKLAFVETILTRRLSGLIAVNGRALDSYAEIIRDCTSISHVIPNGISLERFLPVPSRGEAARKAMGLDPSCKLLLQVGRCNRVKQQHLTVRAVRTLTSQGRDLKTLFGGVVEEPGYRDECIAEIRDLDITFLGTRSDIPDLMDAADVLLMPSYEEAHSVAFLEALASGKPIVASRIPSFLQYEGMEGVTLVDPGSPEYADAIARVLDAGQTRFTRDLSAFTIEATCDAYDAVARDLIAAASGK